MRSFFNASNSLTTALAVALVSLLSACGSGDPEQDAVDAYFEAVKAGDQASLDRIALTGFEGNVESWEIVERGEETEGPFQLADLEAQLREKRAEVDAQKQANQSFIGDNRETYEAYTAKYAEDPSAPFTGELLAFHEELQKGQGTVAQLQADAEQLALDIDALIDAATLSVGTPVDSKLEGQVVVKPIQVRVNDGSGDQTYTVYLQRYDLVDPDQNRPLSSRWIVGEVQG